MDHQARCAFVYAQSVCAMAELMAMQAENTAHEKWGGAKWSSEDFRAVPDRFLIGHNAVIEYLRD